MGGGTEKRQASASKVSQTLVNDVLGPIQQKYNLSMTDLRSILEEVVQQIEPLAEHDTIPSSIFTKKLTVLESLVKFLREERKLSLHTIAELVGRNEKSLWHTYKNAVKKIPTSLPSAKISTAIPLSIFREQHLPPLEILVVYLKEKRGLSYHEIAVLLHRDDRTIWTSYNRAQRKHGNR